jgi:hypothetical protein
MGALDVIGIDFQHGLGVHAGIGGSAEIGVGLM